MIAQVLLLTHGVYVEWIRRPLAKHWRKC